VQRGIRAHRGDEAERREVPAHRGVVVLKAPLAPLLVMVPAGVPAGHAWVHGALRQDLLHQRHEGVQPGRIAAVAVGRDQRREALLHLPEVGGTVAREHGHGLVLTCAQGAGDRREEPLLRGRGRGQRRLAGARVTLDLQGLAADRHPRVLTGVQLDRGAVAAALERHPALAHLHHGVVVRHPHREHGAEVVQLGVRRGDAHLPAGVDDDHPALHAQMAAIDQDQARIARQSHGAGVVDETQAHANLLARADQRTGSQRRGIRQRAALAIVLDAHDTGAFLHLYDSARHREQQPGGEQDQRRRRHGHDVADPRAQAPRRCDLRHHAGDEGLVVAVVAALLLAQQAVQGQQRTPLVG